MVKNDADEEVFKEMEVHRIDAMVRMLCGLNAMGKWKADIDVENKKMRVKCNMEVEYKCMKVNMEKMSGEQLRIRMVIHDEWNIEKYRSSRWKIEISEVTRR